MTIPKKLTAAGVAVMVLLCFAAFTLLRGKAAQEQAGQAARLNRIEALPDQFLPISAAPDEPLRVIEARVKEIPAADFATLTGQTARSAFVSTVPEARLLNISGKKITTFIVAIWNEQTRTSRMLKRYNLSINPGETFLLTRAQFVPPKSVTQVDAAGRATQRVVTPGYESTDKWVNLGGRNELSFRVGLVRFDDGTEWRVQ